ncbi:U1 small nuclear ribonucleoprotein A [Candida viswanathii]|uniref:U1 small nuclear ribonucleoprotein A n=1 Tax=Candida viswanathii TaxID=5486 RepID=A0A367XY24_9ASCO|nr:U1 small nuclear ribonucleoprotein A [Candida viswanathii]
MSAAKKTIYINNLNEKVTANKLKKELRKTFKPCGKILQITALKTLKLKGQAFVTFESAESASKALKMADLEVLSKPMRVSYANIESDVVLLEDTISERKKNRLERSAKKRKLEEKKESNSKRRELVSEWKELPPNHILLIQNVKEFDGLQDFFGDFNGFESIRVVKVKNLAFIEFESEELASSCLDQVSDEQLTKFGPEDEVLLSFAKK